MKLDRLVPFFSLAAALVLAPVLPAADEAAALAVLASADADLYAKAMACDELGRVGTAKAVPVLAKLLADEKLHDYARDGLERIEDPAAGKALLKVFMSPPRDLTDSQMVGLIITLGDRREAVAVPALGKIADNKGTIEHAADAALSALGKIATDQAGKAILKVLAGGFEDVVVPAGHAALAAAEQMEKDGRKEAAQKLRKAAAAVGVPVPVEKKAAAK